MQLGKFGKVDGWIPSQFHRCAMYWIWGDMGMDNLLLFGKKIFPSSPLATQEPN
jgi:hypothetical protein